MAATGFPSQERVQQVSAFAESAGFAPAIAFSEAGFTPPQLTISNL
jgi:hypothetical protein